MQPEISELTFAYLWSWLPYTSCHLSHWDDAIILQVKSASAGVSYILPPMTPDYERAAGVIWYLLEHDSAPARFARVPQKMVDALPDEPDLSVEPQRDRFDYLHRADELRDLPGTRYHPKRNQIRQFEQQCPDAEYQVLTPELATQCITFTDKWLENHPKKDLDGLQREVKTTIRMLGNLEWLPLEGGALVENGRILAFALGEPINDATIAERVEKADTSVSGSYQAINRAFARQTAANFQWINREQDLGLPGLRRAKQSYHPERLVEKYEVTVGE
ncbi:MAG: DUF2156 domain-containing protein [Planctomycetes bacterium]|nr:DUF2156 domain-containing protein [Planctomycetota bacterium]